MYIHIKRLKQIFSSIRIQQCFHFKTLSRTELISILDDANESTKQGAISSSTLI